MFTMILSFMKRPGAPTTPCNQTKMSSIHPKSEMSAHEAHRDIHTLKQIN